MSDNDTTIIAELTVQVTDTGAFMMQFNGDDVYKTTMVGVIELVKRRLIHEYEEALNFVTHDISNRSKTTQKGSQVENIDELIYYTEQEVPRSKALEATNYAIAMLEQRKKDMEESAPEQKFRINPTLLKHL